MAEEVDFKERAKGLAESLEATLEKVFPQIEREVAPGVKVGLKREVSIEDLRFDTESTIVKIKAKVRYYTPNTAVINQLGLGISSTITVETAYNAKTSELTKLSVKHDLPNGWGEVKADFTTLKKLLDGDLAAAFELIPNGGLVKRKSSSEYDARKKEFQDKYGAENVYFASSDFVRWASPETAGKWVLTLIATGGSAAPAIGAEVKAEARKELAHILAFLKNKGIAQAEAAALDFVSGKPIATPKLKLVWQHVKYKSQVAIAGRDLPEIEVTHAAFVLVFETPNKPLADFVKTPVTQSDDNELRPKWKVGARYALGPTGCRVVFLSQGGPLDKAGVKVDEVITKVRGVSVSAPDYRSNSLLRQLKDVSEPEVKFEISSATGTRTVTVTLEPVQ